MTESLRTWEPRTILPVQIMVYNEYGEEQHNLGSIRVRLYMNNTDRLDGKTLFHRRTDIVLDENGNEREQSSWEQLPYTLYELADGSGVKYAEFSTSGLSPFLFTDLTPLDPPQEETVPAEPLPETAPVDETTQSIVSGEQPPVSDEQTENASSKDMQTTDENISPVDQTDAEITASSSDNSGTDAGVIDEGAVSSSKHTSENETVPEGIDDAVSSNEDDASTVSEQSEDTDNDFDSS